MMRTVEALSLLGLLLVAGVAAWWLMLRPVVEPRPRATRRVAAPVDGLPRHGRPMDRSVSEMLDADHSVQRACLHPRGYVVFVYVGYYSTRRGRTPEHTARGLLPIAGLGAHDRRRAAGRWSDGIDVREARRDEAGQ
ncbi:MAG: exosortase-associated EpsI family protein [Myxococcota bacterium]